MKIKLQNNLSKNNEEKNAHIILKKMALNNLKIMSNYQDFIMKEQENATDFKTHSKILNDAKKISSIMTNTIKTLKFVEKNSIEVTRKNKNISKKFIQDAENDNIETAKNEHLKHEDNLLNICHSEIHLHENDNENLGNYNEQLEINNFKDVIKPEKEQINIDNIKEIKDIEDNKGRDNIDIIEENKIIENMCEINISRNNLNSNKHKLIEERNLKLSEISLKLEQNEAILKEDFEKNIIPKKNYHYKLTEYRQKFKNERKEIFRVYYSDLMSSSDII